MLYTGVTGNLQHRISQHKSGDGSRYTSRYEIHRLVYVEEFQYVEDAITREKQIKGYRRGKKLKLIRDFNPTWRDLSEDWKQGE